MVQWLFVDFSTQIWRCPNTFCRWKFQLIVFFLSSRSEFKINIDSFFSKSKEKRVSNALSLARYHYSNTHLNAVHSFKKLPVSEYFLHSLYTGRAWITPSQPHLSPSQWKSICSSHFWPFPPRARNLQAAPGEGKSRGGNHSCIPVYTTAELALNSNWNPTEFQQNSCILIKLMYSTIYKRIPMNSNVFVWIPENSHWIPTEFQQNSCIFIKLMYSTIFKRIPMNSNVFVWIPENSCEF